MGPVRETAAQALGCLSSALPPPSLPPLIAVLAALSDRPEWEVRHGAQLGVQYVMGAREGGGRI